MPPFGRHGPRVTPHGCVSRALAKVLAEGEQDKKWFLYLSASESFGERRARSSDKFRQHSDGVIAIGGGSPLDAGKAARLLARRPNLNFEILR
jgi:alcohol dehydrogenase class IV